MLLHFQERNGHIRVEKGLLPTEHVVERRVQHDSRQLIGHQPVAPTQVLLVVHLLVAVDVPSAPELREMEVLPGSGFTVARESYDEVAFGLLESVQIESALVSHELSAKDEALPTHSLSHVLSSLGRIRELVVVEDFSEVAAIDKKRVSLDLV